MSNYPSLEGPSRPTASGEAARQAIVFLHGYGSDGHDLIGFAPVFATSLPNAAFYSPHAPEPFEMAPFGRQWFTLQGYEPELVSCDPDSMAGVFEAMYEGAQKTTQSLDQYLDRILDDLNLTEESLALIGFSQGAMMALHLGLRRSPSIGAIVGYSGALVGGECLAEEAISKPPILLVHGEDDQVVPLSALSLTRGILEESDIAHEAQIVPNHGHGIEQVGVTLGCAFLLKYLVGA